MKKAKQEEKAEEKALVVEAKKEEKTVAAEAKKDGKSRPPLAV